MKALSSGNPHADSNGWIGIEIIATNFGDFDSRTAIPLLFQPDDLLRNAASLGTVVIWQSQSSILLTSFWDEYRWLGCRNSV